MMRIQISWSSIRVGARTLPSTDGGVGGVGGLVFRGWLIPLCILSICSQTLINISNDIKPSSIHFLKLNSQCLLEVFITIYEVPTHFMRLVSFYTPWKHQKTRGILMFLGVRKRSVVVSLLLTHFMHLILFHTP